MDEKDDRELVKKCIEGSADGWAEFVDRFSGLIYWVIKRKLSKFDSSCLISEAEDIYQHIFASIWEKKSFMNVSDRKNIAPWLIVIASNATIDFIRKRQSEQNFARERLLAGSTSMNENEVILMGESERLIGEAIKFLNEKERAFLEYNYIAGKKHKEIADTFNTSINSVSTIIARAKHKIKKYMNSKDKEV